MGKNNWPDFDAIIQKAVNAGRAQGMSIAKDAYKATERRLYALPVLRQKVEDDKEKLEQIKTHGAPERSKSIVRFSRTGYRLTPEEMLEAIIKDLEATIRKAARPVRGIQRRGHLRNRLLRWGAQDPFRRRGRRPHRPLPR